MRRQRIQNLGVLLQTHDGRFLPEVFKQIKQLLRGREGYVVPEIATNSQQVIHALDRALIKFRADNVVFHPCESGGSLKVQGEAILVLSDDLLLPRATIKELRAHLEGLRYHHLQCQRLFCWDSEHHYNRNFPQNFLTLLIAEQRTYPLKVRRLKNPILDMRYLTEEDREFQRTDDTIFEEYLVRPPRLEEVPIGG